MALLKLRLAAGKWVVQRSELLRRFCAGVGVCCANMLSTFIAAFPSGTVPFPRTTTAQFQRATAPVARANSDAESAALLAAVGVGSSGADQ